MMDNRSIRLNARKALVNNRLRIFFILLVHPFVYLLVSNIFIDANGYSKWFTLIINYVIIILIFPITDYGSANALLNTWQHGISRWDMLINRILSKKDYLKAVSLVSFVYLPSAIVQTLTLFFDELHLSIEYLFYDLIFVFIAILLLLWVSLRLGPSYYAGLLYPQMSGIEAVKVAFKAMKGYVWWYIRLYLSASWWAIIAFIIFNSIFNELNLPLWGKQLLMPIVSTLLFVYPRLVTAGFYVNRLKDCMEVNDISVAPRIDELS